MRDVTAESIRRQVGIVLQDTFLFSTTVMENVRFGRPDASDEEVKAAAQLANADSFIERLPQKYETVLGERGSVFPRDSGSCSRSRAPPWRIPAFSSWMRPPPPWTRAPSA